jgi:diguanylate cyclase (GGDEF)-like protein
VPYARELGIGDARLRFSSELEPQYLQHHLRRVRSTVRAWLPLYVSVATICLVETMVTGQSEDLATLAVFVMTTYFFTGLLLRGGQTLAVLMIDIDHFKSYNDSFGHIAGDSALRRVAETLREFARRPLDLAARYGGEEFGIILFDLTRADVEDVAERLRLAVAQESDRVAGDEPGRAVTITISIGVAIVAPQLDHTPRGAVQLADEALYEAKRSGRDRVVVSGTDEYRKLQTGSFRTFAGGAGADRSPT